MTTIVRSTTLYFTAYGGHLSQGRGVEATVLRFEIFGGDKNALQT